MAEWDVIAVEPRGHLCLAVRFADRAEGTVRLERSALSGVFEPLRDPGFFDKVFIEDGAATWPGEVDIAPDAMHDEIRSRGEWVIA